MSKNIKSGSDVANPVIPPVLWAEDQVNDLSFRAVDPVSVLVKDLNVTIDVSPGGLSTFAINAFCVVNCGESLGIIINTLFDNIGFAVNVTSVVLSIAQIMGEVMSPNIPAFLQVFNHLSPVKWSIGNLAPRMLAGVTFSCTEAQRLPNGQCPVTDGEDVLNIYNLNGNAGWNLPALGICVVVYPMLAFLLKAKRTRWARRERSGWGRSRGENAETVKPTEAGESALQSPRLIAAVGLHPSRS